MVSLLAISLFLGVLPVSVAPNAPEPPPPTKDAGALPGWYDRVNTGAPGTFAPVRSFTATYGISWGGLSAAHVEAQCVASPGAHEIRSTFKAATTGAARVLYKVDATHLSVVDRNTLLPVFIEQSELNSRKHIAARVDFTRADAVRVERDLKKDEHDPAAVGKAHRLRYPGLYDMQGAFLYLRSLPLATGDEKTIPLMTAGSPYLATVKVLGRNRVQVKAGEFAAIECSLKLEKIRKDGTLEPRKGFKSARAWISDDANRMLVKAEAEIFVGSVDLELEQVNYTGEAAR